MFVALTFCTAFDWCALKPGSLVVDVGGSLGHVSMEIAKAFPDLKIAHEDLPSTSQDALQACVFLAM